MTSVSKAAQAGTLESNDIMIIVGPGSGGIALDIESIVGKQFGAAIRQSILEGVRERGITDIQIKVIDKGALDYTIRARLATALARAGLEADGGLS